MATWNGEKFVREQVSSINAQIDITTKIYFSDDCSTDKTPEILRKMGCYEQNKGRVKYGSSANNFLSLIKNVMVDTEVDYIALSDQDDIWFPNKISVAVSKLSETDSDCYSGSYFIFRGNHKNASYKNKYFHNTGVEHFFRSPGPGFTFCFKRESFLKIQEVISKLNLNELQIRWHDWLIFAISQRLKLKWYIDERAYSFYRQHNDNDTGQAINLKGVLFRLRFLFFGDFNREVAKLGHIFPKSTIIESVRKFGLKDRIYLLKYCLKARSDAVGRLFFILWLILGKTND